MLSGIAIPAVMHMINSGLLDQIPPNLPPDIYQISRYTSLTYSSSFGILGKFRKSLGGVEPSFPSDFFFARPYVWFRPKAVSQKQAPYEQVIEDPPIPKTNLNIFVSSRHRVITCDHIIHGVVIHPRVWQVIVLTARNKPEYPKAIRNLAAQFREVYFPGISL